MGRLRNDQNMGYVPTDGIALQQLAAQFERQCEGIIRAVDLCCADGSAIATLGEVLQAETYGCELNEQRGAQAKKRLSCAWVNDLFQMIVDQGIFQVMLFNPPYTYATAAEGETAERLEAKMWDVVSPLLQKPTKAQPDSGGVMILIVSAHNLTWQFCKKITRQYGIEAIWRYQESKYNQVIIVGRRKAKANDAPEEELRLNLLRTEGEIIPSLRKRKEFKELDFATIQSRVSHLSEPSGAKIMVPVVHANLPFRFFPWKVEWAEIGERFDESSHFQTIEKMCRVNAPEAERIPMLMPPRIGHLLPLLKTMGSAVLRDKEGQNPLLLMLREERDVKKWTEETENKLEHHTVNPTKEFLTGWNQWGDLVVFR